MARKKISEFASKRVILNFLALPYSEQKYFSNSKEKNGEEQAYPEEYTRINNGVAYSGITIDTSGEYYEDLLVKIEDGKKYILKVDQGIKQRKKKNLISFDITKENVKEEIKKLQEKGYRCFILEEFVEHESSSEFYFALERTRDGNLAHFSKKGGVDIEENKKSITTLLLKSPEDTKKISDSFNLDIATLNGILSVFDKYYFSFLEINPLVIKNGEVYFLDTAVEVDSAAEFFVEKQWTKDDYREVASRTKSSQEIAILKLKEKSPAAFSFELLNSDGSLFLLLSGGGASLVIADEVYQQGKGEDLANYGEYSGNPNQEETYIYTKNVLELLLLSKAPKKVLIISGGVANFTDIRITFKGIIKALDEVSEKLQEQKVKIFVRRGGPNQKEGLTMMSEFLKQNNLLGEVHGPELILTDIVKPAIEYVNQ